jgi:hypothetical protein
MIVDSSNRENVEGWRDRDMGIRTLLKRIEQAEKALQARSIFSADCICFQENEPPFFCFPSEEEIAARVKCPLHCNRFRQPIFHIYVTKWRRERFVDSSGAELEFSR